MSELFDDISRIVGSQIPRRQALRLIVGGITAAVLSNLGFEHAAQAQSATCRVASSSCVPCSPGQTSNCKTAGGSPLCCAGVQCPTSRFNVGQCCPTESQCCGTGCCDVSCVCTCDTNCCTLERACPPGPQGFCCPEGMRCKDRDKRECCSLVPFGQDCNNPNLCCPTAENCSTCASGFSRCCPVGTSCQQCSNPSGSICCPANQSCINGGCCPDNKICGGTTCCDSDGKCCINGICVNNPSPSVPCP
jgi:hypothetical protein